MGKKNYLAKAQQKPAESKPPITAPKLNIYTCDLCFEHIVTVDSVEGTTPFQTNCKATEGCKGSMQSSFYRVFDVRMKPSHEWYKPDAEECVVLHRYALEHVSKGGLLLRKIVWTGREPWSPPSLAEILAARS